MHPERFDDYARRVAVIIRRAAHGVSDEPRLSELTQEVLHIAMSKSIVNPSFDWEKDLDDIAAKRGAVYDHDRAAGWE
jgi:hypothetical protein